MPTFHRCPRSFHPSRRLLAAAALLLAAAPLASGQLNTASYYDPQDGNRFGTALANVGDVNADGTDDLLVGMPRWDRSGLADVGEVAIIDANHYVVIRYHAGSQVGERFGTAGCALGDLDGDGYADYAIGGPNWNSSTHVDAGRIVAFSGKTGAPLWSVEGTATSERIGTTLAGIADLDGDGLGEILTGLAHLDKVEIYDATGAYYKSITGAAGDHFGAAIARCGDLDGDRHDDFLVGETGFDLIFPKRLDCGRVRVYSSAAHTPLIMDVIGDHPGDHFGYSVAGCGDVDKDKVRDFLAGAIGDDSNGTDSGLARVVSGKDGTTIHDVLGDGDFDSMGGAVAGLADFDGDGRADFVASCPNGGSNALGIVRVFSGKDAHLLHEWEGYADSQVSSVRYGYALASGDWNGDGLGDFAEGDPLLSLNLPGTGWTQTGGVSTFVACPAWWKNYGAGWPGKYGVPSLTALQDPEVGSPIDIAVGNSHAMTTGALLFVGLAQTDLPTSADGHLLVVPLFSFPFTLAAAGTTLSDVLPSDPALYFFDVDLQVIEVDPFASKNLSFTQGLQLHLGFDLP